MSEPQIEHRDEQPYLAVGGEATHGVADFADTAFPELFGWLGRQGIQPLGPPFIRYRELDENGEPLRLEVGVPVADEANGDARVHRATLPEGDYLTLTHVGPYRSQTEPDLAAARERLVTWAEERGVVYRDGSTLHCVLEHYVVGPVDDPDFSNWVTVFAYLVVEDLPA
jgi:effector-binding domain-containing protein